MSTRDQFRHDDAASRAQRLDHYNKATRAVKTLLTESMTRAQSDPKCCIGCGASVDDPKTHAC